MAGSDTDRNQLRFPVDREALRILFNTYWSPAGWKPTRETDPADLEYAQAAGYMFPPQPGSETSHEAVARRIEVALHAVDGRQVAAAFLSSLSLRQPVLRSCLASYALARVFPKHLEQSDRQSSWICAICGYRGPHEDRNVLNFERYKWGGVRHLNPHFVAFNLEQFPRLQVPAPLDEDVELFRRIVETARSLPPTARARDLEKALGAFLPSNKAERENLLDILGIVGVLAGEAHPGFVTEWIPYSAQTLPPVSKIDWKYPMCWWRGGTVSDDALHQFFSGFSVV